MQAAFEDALVEGYEHLASAMTNHPKDRHVLAAAVRCGAHAVVTLNVKDFRPEAVRPCGIEVLTPDDFLVQQHISLATHSERESWLRLGRGESHSHNCSRGSSGPRPVSRNAFGWLLDLRGRRNRSHSLAGERMHGQNLGRHEPQPAVAKGVRSVTPFSTFTVFGKRFESMSYGAASSVPIVFH